MAYRAWNVGIVDCRDSDMAYYLACAPEETKDRYVEAVVTLHDSNFAKMAYYDEARHACLEEYPEFWYADGGFEFEYHREWELLGAELAEQIQNFMESGRWEDTASILKQYRLRKMKDSVLEKLGVMSDVECEELTEMIADGSLSCEAVLLFVLHAAADKKTVLAKIDR